MRVGLTLLAVALIAGFVSLGRWQLRRADEKQHLLDAVATALQHRSAQPLDAAAAAGGYDWAAGRGHILETPILLLDNQRRGDAVGVRVFGVFQPGQGPALLVDLGWLPLPGDRRLPEVTLPAGELQVAGLLAPPPSPGIALGPAYAIPGDAQTRQPDAGGHWLLTRVDLAALGQGLHLRLAPRVLRLDPVLPIGFARDLEALPNTLSPERHRGYAIQWFGLALVTFILALILGFRRRTS